VSRVLTTLRERGVIRFAAVRSVQICNRQALERARTSPVSAHDRREEILP
jgi:hypothetical protein